MSTLSTPVAQGTVFTVQRAVRFSDCAPAGMVFFPQYLVTLNALVENRAKVEIEVTAVIPDAAQPC